MKFERSMVLHRQVFWGDMSNKLDRKEVIERIDQMLDEISSLDRSDIEKCYEYLESLKTALILSEEHKLVKKRTAILLSLAKLNYYVSELNKALQYYTGIINNKQLKPSVKELIAAYEGIAYIQLNKSENALALSYYKQALEILKKQGDQKEIARMVINIGAVYNEMSEYDNALQCFLESEKTFRSLEDEKGINMSLSNQANIAYYQGDFRKALELKLKANKYFEKTANYSMLAKDYNFLSVVYAKQGDYEKAIAYCLKSLKLREASNDMRSIAFSLNNLGVYYIELGNFELALKYYQKALDLREKIGDKNGIALVLNNIGNTYFELKDYDRAAEYFERSRELIIELKDERILISNLIALAGIMTEQKKDLKKAESYLQEAYEIGRKLGVNYQLDQVRLELASIYVESDEFDKAEYFLKETIADKDPDHDLNTLADAYKIFLHLNLKKADKDEALKYMEKYTQLKDRIFSRETALKIAELQTSYDTEKKEREAEIYRLKNVELKAKNNQIKKQKAELEENLQKLRDSEIKYNFVTEELTRNISSSFIGHSKAVKNIINLISTVATSDITNVLITGETGTGKEVVARIIHECSIRKKKHFYAVNCSAIPDSLFESQFFGHEKNAFTGAATAKAGWFEVANGSTLFLDEVGTMTFEQQAKLLRVLEEGKVVKVGSHTEIQVDVRIISATNLNLVHEVEVKKFRIDLFHRLATFVINIPPLRERKEDIPLLLKHFVGVYSKKFNKVINRIEKNVETALLQYDYPGNVRELRNMVERAVLVASSSTLKINDFLIPITLNNESSLDDIIPYEEMEKRLFLKALKATDFNRIKAAKLLNVNRKVVERRIEKYGLLDESS